MLAHFRYRLFSSVPLLLAAVIPVSGQAPVWNVQVTAEESLQSNKNPHLREDSSTWIASIWLKPQIYVCWENPSAQFQKEMALVRQEVAETWEKESQLRFTGWQKCAPVNKGIRILIDDSGPYTKALGRQIDGIPNGMVLNFTFTRWSTSCQATPEYCIKAIAGHEFGHAIGFAHEQNRPDTPGECREDPQGQDGNKLLTPYDEHSIMNYCNPEWNNDGRLSGLDVDAVHQLYGVPPGSSVNAAPQMTFQKGQDAAAQAIDSSSNGHLREHGYVLLASVWLKPQIYVCWENPSSQFQKDMELVRQEVAQTWERESQLRFTGWQKCAPVNKGIRVLIDDSGPHTKALGRQIDATPNGMVLNFTFANWSASCQATRDYCIKAIAGHEFGHAIGFAHEQNRPDKPGECREAPQGENGNKLLTPYDKHSIMNYCNSEWNNDGKLSALDIDAVRKLYGSPATGSNSNP
jgi:hypothetical protein